MAEAPLRQERRDGVALLTLDRPEALNALNEPLLHALDDALESLGRDEATRVVVITGAGERAFAAGGDIRTLVHLMPREADHFGALGRRVMDAIAALPQPVIAAVNGFALGGGLELALACDFIYASERALLGLVEAELGLVPGFGGVPRLVRRIGAAAAREAVYTARRFTAAEALALGLVNRVCAPERLLADALATARLIATRSRHATQLLKSMAAAAEGRDKGAAEAFEAQCFGLAFAHADAREGLSAFLEKRPAAFGGR